MKKSVLLLPAIAVLAACSPNDADNDPVATDAASESVAAPDAARSAVEGATAPHVRADVAPGVAFDYRYNFALPETAISDVQSRHAALCESLTISRCRVTGMRFERDDSGEIAANLDFRLDPALAHGFARDATDIVEAADGRLADSRISGEDAGTAIVANDKSTAGIDAELARIDAQLKIPALSKEVRGKLVEQASELRAQRRELTRARGDKVESLATTPVSFAYAASGGVLGMDDRSPFSRAAKASSSSFMAMIEVVLTLAGALAPWALLGAGAWWIVRRVRAART